MSKENLKKLKDAVAKAARKFKYTSPFKFQVPRVDYSSARTSEEGSLSPTDQPTDENILGNRMGQGESLSSRKFKYRSPFQFNVPRADSSNTRASGSEMTDLQGGQGTPADENHEVEDESNVREETTNSQSDVKETPFDGGIVVFQNDNLKIYILKTAFQKQKRFAMDDHLFLLKIEVLEGKPPLLFDIEDILEKAFTHVIEKLKAFYKPGNQAIIFS